MNRRIIRPLLASGVAAIVCLMVGPRAAAVSDVPFVERLVGSAVNITGTVTEREGPVDIVIEHWSTDHERRDIGAAIGADHDPARLLNSLQMVKRRVGFILSAGLQGTGSRARLRRAYTSSSRRRSPRHPAGGSSSPWISTGAPASLPATSGRRAASSR